MLYICERESYRYRSKAVGRRSSDLGVVTVWVAKRHLWTILNRRTAVVTTDFAHALPLGRPSKPASSDCELFSTSIGRHWGAHFCVCLLCCQLQSISYNRSAAVTHRWQHAFDSYKYDRISCFSSAVSLQSFMSVSRHPASLLMAACLVGSRIHVRHDFFFSQSILPDQTV